MAASMPTMNSSRGGFFFSPILALFFLLCCSSAECVKNVGMYLCGMLRMATQGKEEANLDDGRLLTEVEVDEDRRHVLGEQKLALLVADERKVAEHHEVVVEVLPILLHSVQLHLKKKYS
jgi:hypothetical protein